MTIASLCAEARHRLQAKPGLSQREAWWLLARVLDRDQTHLFAHPEQAVDRDTAERFRALLERRLDGEPFAYLVGEREFYGRSFAVDRRVLIPRPETEHLVEAALARSGIGARVLDLATGSGCVGLTVALERPDLEVVASDASVAALAVARRNRNRLGLAARVPLVCCDQVEAIALDRFDTVACNPPYVDPASLDTLQTEVREHEPHRALFAEEAGFAFYRRLLACSSFATGASLCLEVGAGQLDPVAAYAERLGWRTVSTQSDLAGIPRIVVFEAGSART